MTVPSQAKRILRSACQNIVNADAAGQAAFSRTMASPQATMTW
jgi:hypothetical protein